MTENEAINFFKDFIETLKINGEEKDIKDFVVINVVIKTLVYLTFDCIFFSFFQIYIFFNYDSFFWSCACCGINFIL